MALTNCTATTTVITGIGTNPSERNISTEQFKAKFDEAATNIKTDLNDNIIPDIEAKKLNAVGGTITNYNETTTTIASASGTIDLSLTNGNAFDVTLTGSTTFTFSGAVSGKACSMTILLRQGATSQFVTWPTAVKWSGTAPDLSTINKTYVLSFLSVDGGTTWYGFMGGSF